MKRDQAWIFCPACGAFWPPPATGELPSCEDCAVEVERVRQGDIFAGAWAFAEGLGAFFPEDSSRAA
jgi:hypothetical protein